MGIWKHTGKQNYFPPRPKITGFSFKLLGKQQYDSEKKKKKIGMLKTVTPVALITIITIDTVSYL